MIDLGTYSPLHGVILIGYASLVLAIAIIIFLSIGLYKCLTAQDQAILKGIRPDLRDYLLDIVKKPILWVVGYNGEKREKTTVSKVDHVWILNNKFAIIFRFVPIYIVYIVTLLLLTRPVFYDNGVFVAFNYSKNIYSLYAMLIFYVSTNVICDFVSITYTIKHLREAQITKKYLKYFFKDAIIATTIFLFSQLISCYLWVIKRESGTISDIDTDVVSAIYNITLWPYSFFAPGENGGMSGELFPGQLLITGTVFFPTIIMISIFIVFSIFLNATYSVKKFLIGSKLNYICERYLSFRISTMFQPEEKLKSVGYCNVFFISIFDTVLTAGATLIVRELILA